MSMNLGLGIGLGFQRGGAAAESSPLDVITSSNGAWWVVAERDGSGNLVDQTGGGRNLLLPGGSANPVLLDHTGTDYFWLPGTSGNNLTVPDSAPLSVTSQVVDFRVRCSPSAWSGLSSNYSLVDKADYGTNVSFRWNLMTTGHLQFNYSTTGSNNFAATSTVVTGLSGPAWVRVVYDPSSGDVIFYTAADGDTPSWSQLGATVSTAGGNIYDNNRPVTIGGNSDDSAHFLGRIYRAIMIADATTVLDVNAADADRDATTFAEASSNAATVTINRSTSGYNTAVVDQPRYVFTTDDYLATSGSSAFWNIAADEDLTMVIVFRVHGNDTDGAILIGNRTGAGDGFQHSEFDLGPWRVAVDDTASYTKDTSDTKYNQLRQIALRLDRTANQLEVVDDGVASGSPTNVTGLGALDPSRELHVGGTGSGQYKQMEFIGAAIVKEALSVADIGSIGDALITANGGTP